MTRQPAASIPCGLTSAGLPIGLQIVGPLYAEDRVLRAARAFETTQPERRHRWTDLVNPWFRRAAPAPRATANAEPSWIEHRPEIHVVAEGARPHMIEAPVSGTPAGRQCRSPLSLRGA